MTVGQVPPLVTARSKPAQTAWLNALASVPGIEVHVWRPGDLSEIEHVLRFSTHSVPRAVPG